MRGVVSAGHPLTAEAGANVLRAGGNAVDAAVAAVLMSFVTESPLTGPGAGGFMLVHTAGGSDHLLDFFVAAPGGEEPCELVPAEVEFAPGGIQLFHVGPASCGVYGTTAGIAMALERFGTLGLDVLVEEPARAAREGVEMSPLQEYLHAILSRILCATPEGAAIYEPAGRPLRAGEVFRHPDLAHLLDRLGAEGPGFLYTGDVASAVSDWLLARGGIVRREDLAAYRPVEREPVRVQYGGREVLTNPPPSSGGILIAHALGLLERGDRTPDALAVVEATAATNAARTEEFLSGLHSEGFLESFLAGGAGSRGGRPEPSVEGAAPPPGEAGPPPGGSGPPPGDGLGSTTHISVLDEDGCCASVTCSNGSSSGVIVPETGVHLNNMLGEEDLNPLGFHRHEPGRRVPSMMAPTIVLRDGELELGLGSAGSNRIRSAIMQTIIGVVDLGLELREAVERPRVHLEGEVVDAEPGADTASLEAAGWQLNRWRERNLYFGGVQAVARDPGTGELSGAGDPRRGGAAVLAQ